MAEGFLKSFSGELDVYSAGTFPEKEVNSFAVMAMIEKGIDISKHYPKNVSNFINDSFDYVITVCDNAKEACPVFTGEVRTRLHFGFEDPALAKGTNDEKLKVYRRIRDEIELKMQEFYRSMEQ
jgi:arsenate reductase